LIHFYKRVQAILTMNSKPGPTPGTTVLTPAQTAQLLEKLKGRACFKNIGEGQTIKIQTIQTNPQTGVKQIVAIPIQAAPNTSSAPTLTVSPMKVVRTSTGGESHSSASQSMTHQTTRTIKIGSPRPQTSGQVSLVKHHQQQQLVLNQNTVLTPHKTNTNLVLANTSQTSHAASFSSPSMSQEAALSRPGKRSDIEFETFSESKRRKTDKGGKGLRHFSMKVCEKVKAKGSTSYNEVADELVAELTDPRCQSPSDQQYDQKNIRRRVYDALNVLMAMNIISKEKKEIRWLGLPTNSVQEAYSLEAEKSKRIDRIKDKTRQLQDLIIQQIAFKNLVERNKEVEKCFGAPTPNSAIQLPFIIVNTSKKTVIDCSISNDKMEYLFEFDEIFETHDDMEVLKRMDMDLGLERGQVTEQDLEKARSMVPRALEPYVVQLAQHGKGSYSMPKVSAPAVLVKEDPGSDDLEGGGAVYQQYQDCSDENEPSID